MIDKILSIYVVNLLNIGKNDISEFFKHVIDFLNFSWDDVLWEKKLQIFLWGGDTVKYF